MEEPSATAFEKLFRGNSRCRGRWNPRTRKMWTEHEGPRPADYLNHIDGGMGLGVCPIQDPDDSGQWLCWWGCVDLDVHGEDTPDIDLVALEARVREESLPLIVCRSKSGGAHLYVFFSRPVPAEQLQRALQRWTGHLGYNGAEVFPKQTELPVDTETGEMSHGNWVNLPYFGADTDRYAVIDGKPASLEHFLLTAQSSRVDASRLFEVVGEDYVEAPPCIQMMAGEGVESGYRNDALYAFTVYFKRAFPESWKDRAHDINARVLSPPLDHSEASRTISSAGRRDYQYKCGQEPCRSRCMASTCVMRKYGITPQEQNEIAEAADAEEGFTALEKLLTDPPRWTLILRGSRVTVTSAELLDYRSVRRRVMEVETLVLPPMKGERWERLLANMMANVVEIEAPDEASTSGLIVDRLCEFCDRADPDAERDSLLLDQPVVEEREGVPVVYFRGPAFVDFLRRSRADELRGANLWLVLREAGVEHTRIRVEGKPTSVWYVPRHLVEIADIDKTIPEPEL